MASVVLGIETSCDETAAAVVQDGARVLSSVVASQVDLHAMYGGVVPEIASRAHLELLTPIIEQALREASLGATGSSRVKEWTSGALSKNDSRPGLLSVGSGYASVQDVTQPSSSRPGFSSVDAVAATVGPGLIGSLLVGVAEAKALAAAFGVPFVAVNHLEAHLFASLLEEPEMDYPVVVLLVSGGHTLLLVMYGPLKYRLLGQTLDDAAGEAFDKVARFLGLGYPGGPAIDRAAKKGDPHAVNFPRAMLDGGYDFSFSGLKTAVVNYVRGHPDCSSEDIAASFQAAVVDVLLAKGRMAVESTGAKGWCLAGGVAANSELRRRVAEVCAEEGVRAHLPSLANCTDNAAMVAAAGWWRLRSDGPSPLSTGAYPGAEFPL